MAPAKHVVTALAHAVAQVSQTWWGRERPDDERAPRGCERCGKRDGALMEIRLRGRTRIFDCFECAIHAMAPAYRHCGSRVIGHGIEGEGRIFCSAHCENAARTADARP